MLEMLPHSMFDKRSLDDVDISKEQNEILKLC